MVHGHIVLRPMKDRSALKGALENAKHKLESTKVPRSVQGESRSEQVERINRSVKESGVIGKAIDRAKRRHLGGHRTSKEERKEFMRSASSDR